MDGDGLSVLGHDDVLRGQVGEIDFGIDRPAATITDAHPPRSRAET
jgi:hypothetical protein